MLLEGGIEGGVCIDRTDALSWPDMVRKFAAEIIVEVAMRQPCKEVACKLRKAGGSGELANCDTRIFGRCAKQAWKLSAADCGKAVQPRQAALTRLDQSGHRVDRHIHRWPPRRH